MVCCTLLFCYNQHVISHTIYDPFTDFDNCISYIQSALFMLANAYYWMTTNKPSGKTTPWAYGLLRLLTTLKSWPLYCLLNNNSKILWNVKSEIAFWGMPLKKTMNLGKSNYCPVFTQSVSRFALLQLFQPFLSVSSPYLSVSCVYLQSGLLRTLFTKPRLISHSVFVFGALLYYNNP